VENGFILVVDQANLGILETDWAENRAKLPQDFVRRTVGAVFDSLYSTGERDKFRTRLERTASGGTEIYISHRGMAEVYNSSSKDSTVWQQRAVDPELETEFLRRLMVKLGVPQDKAQVAVSATATVKPVASVTTINGLPGLQISDGFDRAWRRVGLALDRSGFTVEDRDRTQGTYFVRYVESGGDKKEGNFLTKLFSGGDAAAALQKFRVVLKSEGDKTTLTVVSATAAPEAAANAQRIVKLIADDLK
jgi:outer membrane protein assembly factor BamC